MGTISTGIGLISGLDIDSIVSQLMAIEARPRDLLQARVQRLSTEQTALMELSGRLLSLKSRALGMRSASSLRPAVASSSDESVLTATASDGAPAGSYSVYVKRLARVHSLVSQGLRSKDTALGSEQVRYTPLSFLNGQQGVDAGSIRITDRSGHSAVIDLSSAVTVKDVIDAINSETSIRVTVSLDGDHIVLTDSSGSDSHNLTVEEVDGHSTAADLGILQDVDGDVITGTDVNNIVDSTLLSQLNNGNGVGRADGDDFRIELRDGTIVDVDIGDADTVGAVLEAINSAGAGKLAASISSDGNGITIVDYTSGEGTLSVSSLNSATTAEDLGILGQGNDVGVLEGEDLIPPLQDVSSTTITFELGDARLYRSTRLEMLNGGEGVGRGIIRITDRSGASSTVDLTAAITIDDVLAAINSAAGVSVSASVSGDSIVITDNSGGSGNLVVQDVGSGTAASSLGIAGSVAADVLTGQDIVRLSSNMSLLYLNDGNGIRTAEGLDDIVFALRDGSTFGVDLSDAQTVGDVLDAINNDPDNSGALTAAISADGNSISITDNTAGSGTLTVSNGTASYAATDLGLEGEDGDGDGVITGRYVIAGLNTVLLRSLNGGSGVVAGIIQITDRAGNSSVIDLSNAQTVADVINAINDPAVSAQVTAGFNNAGNGVVITDTSGGSGKLLIEDQSGSLAADLGITVDDYVDTVNSGNLQLQYISQSTPLSRLNGGEGISRGKFRITDSTGQTAVVDLTQGNEVTVGDVLDEINSRGLGILARINDTGDGIIVEDTAAGGGVLRIEDLGDGQTAAQLRIAGTATPSRNYIDGTNEQQIEILSTDSLQDIADKINAAGLPVQASIVNDGSQVAPYRLMLTSTRSGLDGRIFLDASNLGFELSTLVEPSDALLYFGEPTAGGSIMVCSDSNEIDNVLDGVTLTLHSASEQPVTVTVSHDVDEVVSDVSSLVDDFNSVLDRIDELTSFNSETLEQGLLLGDASVEQVRSALYRLVGMQVEGVSGSISRFSQIGVRVGTGGRLQLDEDKLRSALQNRESDVVQFFTLAETGMAQLISDVVDDLTDENGVLTRRNDAIDQRKNLFNDRIEALNDLLDAKEQRLRRQFYMMELALAKLQGQQSALASFTPITYSSSSSSNMGVGLGISG